MNTKAFVSLLAALSLAGAARAQSVDTILSGLGLSSPNSVVLDNAENIYITDSGNHRIVKFVTATATLTTVAGVAGQRGYTASGIGLVTKFDDPKGIVFARGGLIVADFANHCLRFVSLADGYTTNLAGQPTLQGSWTNPIVHFRYPMGLAYDATSNDVYVADWGNDAIRKLDSNNVVTTIISNNLYRPGAVSLGANGELWVAEPLLHVIKVFTNGVLKATIGATGISGTNDARTAVGARFNMPSGLFWVGGSLGLLVSDTGNNALRRVYFNANTNFNDYTVETLAGSIGQGGLVDGPLATARFSAPAGLCRDPEGNGFVVVDSANNAVRRLQTSPPMPRITAPEIGWVDHYLEVYSWTWFRPVTNSTFNNEVTIAIVPEEGTQTYFTYGPTPADLDTNSIPDPTPNNGQTPPPYLRHQHDWPIQMISPIPDLTVKARSSAVGRQASPVVQARFVFQVASPLILGDNPGFIVLSNVTDSAVMFYTTDGVTDPSYGATTNNFGPVQPGEAISLVMPAGADTLVFKARGFRPNFKPSSVATKVFSTTNAYLGDLISFGFLGGEASSDFVAAPGQKFFAPITLSLKSPKIVSMQFNLSVADFTNALGLVPALENNFLVGFQTMLKYGENYIPTALANTPIYPNVFFDRTNFLGIGWLERENLKPSEELLYDTDQQHLVQYSQAHDVTFLSGEGKVIVGAFSFRVPASAGFGDTYRIEIGRPSATSDGVRDDVYLGTVTNGWLTNAPLTSVKKVTVGQRRYVVGDVAPFRWFNAGDFGDMSVPTLINNDVAQIFQTAVYRLNAPWTGTDFFDGMDSCCTAADGVTDLSTNFLISVPTNIVTTNYVWTNLYVTNITTNITVTANYATNVVVIGGVTNTTIIATNSYITNVVVNVAYYPSTNLMILTTNASTVQVPSPTIPADPNQMIDQIVFGNGQLLVNDIFVTFRRSLDPRLKWFARYWSGGRRQFIEVTNNFRGGPGDEPGDIIYPTTVASTGSPLVVFSAGDVMGAAGQSVTVPIIAEVTGSLPLRVLLLNLTVQPVDGAPALTVPVQFAPAALGVPNYTSAHGPANYAAVWLMTQIVGLTGSNLLGTLTVTLPTNAPADAAYAVVFGQGISGSHNGINLIPQQLHNGLLTLGPRSGSTWTDGIPDAWRLRYFLSITNLLSHAQADADGDGVPNWAEFKAGTDPVDVRSKLQVLTQRATTGARRALTLRWPTVPNKRYVLEGAPSLLRTNWTTIATDIVGDGGEKQFTDPDPTTRGIQFFRVRVAE